MNEPTTWDEFGEMLARAQRTAAKNYDAVADNLMRGARHEDVFPDLAYALKKARADLNNLATLAIRLAPPERPDRLAVALAGIEALGHYYEIRGRGYIGRDQAAVGSRLVGTDGFRGETHAELLRWTDVTENGEAVATDVTAAAEARLEQLKELREQQRAAVEPTEEDIEAFLTAIGAGPEEVDTEHEAKVAEPWTGHGRWNVWAKDQRERVPGWWIANANLNEEQARAAVERRKGTDDCEFLALPLDQVPGGPPVDASDALVFLNPDAEVQPITGPTDAEEAALARADREQERMASEGEGE